MDVYALSIVCKYLNIEFSYEVFSNSKIQINEVNYPDEWALKITKALGANEYYNLPGGEAIFDRKKYSREKY